MDVSWVLSWVLELECANRSTACLGELSALSPRESQPPAAKILSCSTRFGELLFQLGSKISSFCLCGLMKRLKGCARHRDEDDKGHCCCRIFGHTVNPKVVLYTEKKPCF